MKYATNVLAWEIIPVDELGRLGEKESFFFSRADVDIHGGTSYVPTDYTRISCRTTCLAHPPFSPQHNPLLSRSFDFDLQLWIVYVCTSRYGYQLHTTGYVLYRCIPFFLEFLPPSFKKHYCERSMPLHLSCI